MKTIKLIAIGIILFASTTIHAQISINLNIGTAPTWGPVGYAEAEYYYLPDVEAYYDVRATQFIYFGGGRWIRSRHLPYQYRNYDLYDGYKVVLNDYHGSRPYSNFKNHKVKYYRGYHGREQRNMGHNNNRRVYVNQRGDDDDDRRYDHDDRRYDNDDRREYKKHDNRNNGNGHGKGKGHDRD
ncbi:hypothetical protein ACNQGP_08400 [Flavobacterium sp. GT2N3]|uniref:hypothetical protein n=1 Tax=unclassified Flavobacterium TaxID=196869 RepID=UPI003AAAF8CC